MPTYEYNCDKCGVFECRQSFNDAVLERCPTCDGPVKRIISRNVNVIYRSSGFYVSDHRSADYRSKAGKDGGDSPATGKTAGDSGSPAKPAESPSTPGSAER